MPAGVSIFILNIMRVGIFTQPLKENYGGILQNMALQRVLRRMGHYPVTIDYQTWRPPFHGRIRLAILRALGKTGVVKTRNDFERFIHAQINVTASVDTERKLRRCMRRNHFDAVIIGSDQVWRKAYNPRLDWCYLSFAGKLPKVAYAASIGIDYWDYSPEQTERCAELLSDFRAVSVREASAVALCREYLHRDDVQVVLDPTMLLDAEDYPMAKVATSEMPYIFTYLLDWDEDKGQCVRQLKQRHALNEIASEYDADGVHRSRKMSIEEWLGRLARARMVVCDSFHGTVFSILNHRPFVVLCNPERGNTRMQWLLEMFGLQSRMIDNVSQLDTLAPIDWTIVDAILACKRAESLAFLREALCEANQ